MSTAREGNVEVGIFTHAFSYPASLSRQALEAQALEDLGLKQDDVEFLKQDNDKLACIIKNNKFTLQYVQKTYTQNQGLLEQLQRAAEALTAFKDRIDADDLLIDNLRAQLLSAQNEAVEAIAKYEQESLSRKLLQDRLDKLKDVVNSGDYDTIFDNPEQHKPKIPKLQLPMNGIIHADAPLPPREHRNGLTTIPNESRNGLVTSPREFRNGPRDIHHTATQDANTQTLRYLVSPREGALPNGKRPSPETTSPRTGRHLLPNGVLETSPRGIARVKDHMRRHSANFEDPIRRSGETNCKSSPRSKSSSEIPPNYFDLTQPLPDVHSLQPVVHSYSYSDTHAHAKRKHTISHMKSKSEPQIELSSDSSTQCRDCSCETFRVAGKADWICVCGHINIKHSVSPFKASPSPSPTVSPRKFG